MLVRLHSKNIQEKMTFYLCSSLTIFWFSFHLVVSESSDTLQVFSGINDTLNVILDSNSTMQVHLASSVGCRDDTDCDFHEACISNQCLNPCASLTACGTNANCDVINHSMHCTCPSGLSGNPNIKCDRDFQKCVRDDSCGLGRYCKGSTCRVTCSSDSECLGKEGCIVDYDCGSRRICLNYHCLNFGKLSEDPVTDFIAPALPDLSNIDFDKISEEVLKKYDRDYSKEPGILKPYVYGRIRISNKAFQTIMIVAPLSSLLMIVFVVMCCTSRSQKKLMYLRFKEAICSRPYSQMQPV